jgi:hypothetical protein
MTLMGGSGRAPAFPIRPARPDTAAASQARQPRRLVVIAILAVRGVSDPRAAKPDLAADAGLMQALRR